MKSQNHWYLSLIEIDMKSQNHWYLSLIEIDMKSQNYWYLSLIRWSNFIILTCNFCIYYGNIYVLSYYFVIVFFSSMFILNVVYHHLWYVILFYRLNTYNRVCKSIAHKQLCFYLIDFLNAISIPQVGYLTKYYDNG